jgi:hypothetical protein
MKIRIGTRLVSNVLQQEPAKRDFKQRDRRDLKEGIPALPRPQTLQKIRPFDPILGCKYHPLCDLCELLFKKSVFATFCETCFYGGSFRSENDFWSRTADADTLANHLLNAKQVRVLTLPKATHFVHLDRAERGRATLISPILDFLSK